MERESSLRERLKIQTMMAHDKIEQNPILSQLISPGLSLVNYVKILKRYLGFFRPLELSLSQEASLMQLIPDFHDRRRTQALVADLHALGMSESEILGIPDCADVPELAPSFLEIMPISKSCLRQARFLGINYVLEGSTLGGSMMAKRLSVHPFLSGACLNFLSGHREQTGAFWQRFIWVLGDVDERNRTTLPQVEFVQWQSAATMAAEETFSKMDLWMEQA